MKKVYFCGLTLLCASLAMTQTVSASVTINLPINNCSVVGATSVSTDFITNTMTVNGGTLQGSGCTSNTNTTTSYVTVTPSSSISYTLGTTWPGATIHWSSADSTVSCSVTNSGGLITNPTAANDWAVGSPTTAGTFGFPLNCSSSTAGTGVSVSPTSVSLTVSNPVVQGSCDVSQTSDSVWGATLSRQCNGTVTYSGGYFSKGTYTGDVSNLDLLLTDRTHLGSFPKYFSGYSMTPTLSSGQYVALKFTVSAEGQMQLTNDPSFGDAGVISISPASAGPGRFTIAGGAICTQSNGASTSMLINTPAVGPGDCNLKVGQTYYLNFAAVNVYGQNLCFNGSPNNCTNTKLSYSELSASY